MLQRVQFLLMFVLLLGALSCSHAVNIESDPPGAQITVDGQRLGTAPVLFTETTGWNKTYEVKATLNGYDPLITNVRQTAWNTPIVVLSVAPVLLGGCLISPIGLLWAQQLPDRVVIVMESDADLKPPGTDIEYGY